VSNDDFEVDPEQTARELRDQAMWEDGYTDPRLWRPLLPTVPEQQNRRSA
jgi:hypothetical protein